MVIHLTGDRYQYEGQKITRLVGDLRKGDDGPWRVYSGGNYLGDVKPSQSPAIAKLIEERKAARAERRETYAAKKAERWGSDAWFGSR